jgi:hypothetical protein
MTSLDGLSVAAPVSRPTELIDMVPDLLRATNEVSARLQEAAASSTAYPAVV